MDVTFNRQTVITFPENSDLPDITEGIAMGSLYVDELMFTDRFTVGTCHANRFEVELYNFPMIGKEKIYVYQIIDEVEGEEPINKPIFTGYVDTCKTNRGRFEDSKQIVAYDPIYSLGTMDVSAWWEACFDTETAVTVKYLRDSLCEFVGIPYDDVILPNDDVLISQTQQLNIISFQAMLTYILQINGTNANVDSSGVLRFMTISDEEPIEIDDTYAQNTSEFDTYVVPPYRAVRITNTTENVIANAGNNENYFHIVDNLLLLDKPQLELETIAMNILVAIDDIEYRPAKIDMIYSNLDIHVGMRVKINSYIYLVCENTLSGSQLVDQQISSLGKNEIAQSSTTYDASKKDMQDGINAGSMKYYRYQSQKAQEIEGTRPIISIRYTSTNDGVIFFHGCVIIDVERIDDTEPGIVKIQYSINNTLVRDYVPTETYFHDGRYTLNLLHFWESLSGRLETLVVYLTTENCKITIGAFRNEAYMEGMGLAGETVWDGIIEAEENITFVDFRTTPITVGDITDQVQINAIEPISLEFTDYADGVELKTVPNVLLPTGGELYINKYPLRTKTWGEVKEMTWEEDGIYDATTLKHYGW